ncbi:MAG: hypothetical protein U5N86_11410 [Planctomycetota bacterium]|nr:hypothetical protein [Planctomycetota bacterium]
MAKKEIIAVFKALGIRTVKDRQRFDFAVDKPKPSSGEETTFIRVESESPSDQGAEDAKLERDSRRA